MDGWEAFNSAVATARARSFNLRKGEWPTSVVRSAAKHEELP
jgi:hypothetical protein